MRHSLATRFERRTKSNIFLVVLLFVQSLVAAFIGLGAAGLGFFKWAEATFDWRDQEYAKLTSLHAGYTRAKFESVLGEPVFDRESRNGKFREQTYRRREHWVQTISDASDSVVLYSVTSCSSEFRPRFRVYGVARSGRSSPKVELNVSKFSAIADDAPMVDFAAPGATANSRFHDIAAGGNPSNYKTFIWGLNDVCPDWFTDKYPKLLKTADFGRFESTIWKSTALRNREDERRMPKRRPAWIQRIRASWAVNTYAETAPLFDRRELPDDFQVGADRILTRTTDVGSP